MIVVKRNSNQQTDGSVGGGSAGGGSSGAVLAGFPGGLVAGAASWADYKELAGFHYAAGAPAVPCAVAGVWHEQDGERTLAGVAVVSHPTLRNACREAVLGVPEEGRAAWVNKHVRAITRVIVHPTYRGLGVGKLLVRQAIDAVRQMPEVRFVEATARMGRFHPLFEKCGMVRCVMGGLTGDKPAYFFVMVRS